MTEKENIAEALEFIESFLSAKGGDEVIEIGTDKLLVTC